MHKIDDVTALTLMPAPGAAGSVPNGFFSGGDLGASILPTRVDFIFLNTLQDEIANVITAAGGTLRKDAQNQLITAIRALVAASNTGSISNPLTGDLAVIRIHAAYYVVFALPLTTNKLIVVESGGVSAVKARYIGAPGASIAGQLYNSVISITPGNFKSTSTGITFDNINRIGTLDDDTALSANSSTRAATEHAIKSYVDSLSTTARAYVGYTDTPVAASSVVYLDQGVPGTSSGAVDILFFIVLSSVSVKNFYVVSDVDPITSYTFEFKLSITGGSDVTKTLTINGGSFEAVDTGSLDSLGTGSASLRVKMTTASGAATSNRITFGFQQLVY